MSNPILDEAIRAHAAGHEVYLQLRGVNAFPCARSTDVIKVLGSLVEIRPVEMPGNRCVFLAEDVASFNCWVFPEVKA